MTARRITILEKWLVKAGPSREELFDCLRLFNEHRHVELTLQAGMEDVDPWRNPNTYRLKALVNGIRPEDGSGHSWIVRVLFVDVEDEFELAYHGPFELYYHDQVRRGAILRSLATTEAAV